MTLSVVFFFYSNVSDGNFTSCFSRRGKVAVRKIAKRSPDANCFDKDCFAATVKPIPWETIPSELARVKRGDTCGIPLIRNTSVLLADR